MPCSIKNGFKEGYRNLDDKTDNILNDFIPIDILPDTNSGVITSTNYYHLISTTFLT